MKHIPIYALLMFVLCTSGKGQSKPELPKDDTKPEIKEVVTSDAPKVTSRTIIQDRNGNIWIAANDGSMWIAADGVFHYHGSTITHFKSKEAQ